MVKYYLDTFDGAKTRFLNRGKKRRSVSTLSIPRASDRGVEWVDFEKPLVDLERETERLKRFSNGRPFHLDDHLKNLEEKLHLSDLEKVDLGGLLKLRYEKFRKMGSFMEVGEG